MFLTRVSIGLCPTSFKIWNLLWCFQNKTWLAKLLQETRKAPIETQAVKYSILGQCSLKLIVTSSTFTVPWCVSISELNISEIRIRLEIFWAHVRIDKIIIESNICLLKQKILCWLILIQSSIRNIIYPARDQDLLGSKPGLSSLYVCQQKN